MPARGLQLLCLFFFLFFSFLLFFSIRATGFLFIFYCCRWSVTTRAFSINPLCSISANGEFPPVVTTPGLPFRPTIRTPPPSIRSPPMIFPTTDYCKCKFDCYHSAESERWSSQMQFHCTGELSPSPSVSFSSLLFFFLLHQTHTDPCFSHLILIPSYPTRAKPQPGTRHGLQQSKCAPYWCVPHPHLSECCRALLWH